MSTVVERLDVAPERLWLGTVLGLVAGLVGGALAAPERVYDGFVWHYFWGPVQADANGAQCAIRPGSTVEYLYSAGACAAAAEPVAEPGYTVISEIGYVVVLLLALIGVVFLLRRLSIADDSRFYLGLVPFMFFGGAVRVVEDATDAGAGLDYPLNTLFISPIIYVTVFVLVFGAVLVGLAAKRRGLVAEIYRPLAGAGVAATAVTLAYLLVRALRPDDPVALHAQVAAVVLVVATAAAAVTWKLLERYAPRTVVSRPLVAFAVLWAHSLDGVANVVGLNFMPALGAGPNLIPKHPVNLAIVEFTGDVLPAGVVSVTGDAWPFLLVKLAAAAFVVSVFDDQLFEETPRFGVLLLIAVTAVGLGPGSRDMIRATFGV